MDRSVVESIRQQADDLRDELKELEQWEEATIQREDASKARKGVPAVDEDVVPPIRGTVPSLKEAVASSSHKQGTKVSGDQAQIQAAKEKGNEYFRLGKVSQAIEAYTTGINVAPNSVETHVLYGNRSMCYLKEMQWDKAEQDATTCLQLNRGYAKAYYRRALARKNMGKLEEARGDAESVLALVPDDQSAKTELDVITKMLQVQRAKESSGPAIKKKIVIEEVDDDDDDDDETATGAAPSSLSQAEEKERQARIQQHMADVAKARQAQEEAARAAALRQEKEQSMRQRTAQGHSRVEIVEDDEDAREEQPTNVAVTPEERTRPVSSATAATTASTVATKHTDPAANAAPAPPSEKPKAATSPAPALPTQLRASTMNKDSLAAPKTFTEFERTFNAIKDNQDLLNHYVSLMNPAGMASLFKSNMSPAMLSGIVSAIAQFPGSTGFQFLKGLSKVSRVDELTLFFSEAEKKLLTDALNIAKSSGADAKEVDALKKKLMPF